jgi:hypothetical protein
MKKALIPDAPPGGYVPLSTAFERFCERHQKKEPTDRIETEAEWSARRNSDDEPCRIFLDHLGMGRLHAIVCHPITREKMPIPSEAWRSACLPRLPLRARVITGQEGEGFLAYKDRTPFVSEAELSAILCPEELRNAATPARSRGEIRQPKKNGPGRYASADRRLVEKMHRLFSKRKVHSPNEAAHKVAQEALDRAEKRGPLPAHLSVSVESIARRLRKRYREYY